jgi:hypothetical protein
MSDQREVMFCRLPISLPCPVAVLPGTPQTMRGDDVIPMEERTEACALDAFWMLGGQLLCDVHAREACELLGIDYEDLLAEAGGPARCETVPWPERHRYEQTMVKRGTPRGT